MGQPNPNVASFRSKEGSSPPSPHRAPGQRMIYEQGLHLCVLSPRWPPGRWLPDLVFVEALGTEMASSATLIEVSTRFVGHAIHVFPDQFLLLGFVLDPVIAGYEKVRCASTHWAGFDPFSIRTYDLPPRTDALQAAAVSRVGQNSESPLPLIGLVKHHIHAHATLHVFTAPDGERLVFRVLSLHHYVITPSTL